jgi:hypothetical protein
MSTSKEKFFNIFEIVLWFIFAICSICVYISAFQLFKDTYFYVAASSLIGITLIVRRAKIFTWYTFISGLIYAGCILNYFLTNRASLGIHVAILITFRCLMYGLFAVYIFDLIRTHNIARLSHNNRIFCIITLTAFSLATVIIGESLYIIICPILAWFLTPMTRKEWQKRLLYLSYASYLAFLAIAIISLIKEPTHYENGRYIGILKFPVVGGLLAVIGLFSVAYHWYALNREVSNKKRNNIIHLILLLFPTAFMFITLDRASFLGIVFALLAFYIMSSKNHKAQLKRLITILTLFTLVALGSVIVIKIGLSLGYNKTWTYDELGPHSTKTFVERLIHTTFSYSSAESTTGVFKPGTVLNALDALSSYRLGLWVSGIKQVKLFGNIDTQVYLPNGNTYGHVHSTFIYWLMRLGWLGGVLMIIWFFSFMTTSIKRDLRKENIISLSTLWIAFCFGFFLVERELWTNLTVVLLLLLQYPFIIETDT